MTAPKPSTQVQLDTFDHALSLLSVLGFPAAPIAAFKKRLEGLRGAAGSDANFGADVAAFEQDFMQFDLGISTTEFRRQLLARRVDEDWLLDYARMLTWGSFDNGERRDRFELVASRALLKQGDPPFQIEPLDTLRPLIGRICDTAPAVPEEARKEAIDELDRARNNLGSFETLDDLLGQGHYLDVRGYKISLRDRLLDPAILYAVVHWNSAFLNRIRDLTFAQSRPEYEVDALLRRQADEIDEIFSVSSVDTDTAKARVNVVRETVRMSMPSVQRANTQRAARETQASGADQTRKLSVALAIVAIVLAGLIFLPGVFRDQNDLEELSSSEVVELSPFLASGSISQGSQSPIFNGEVNSDWDPLGDGEKADAAKALLDNLKRRGVESMTVRRGKTVVMQASAGRIRLVEKRESQPAHRDRGF
ncbi:MAG: hypothetical protein R3A78_11760 [Polyangiales bacterium]